MVALALARAGFTLIRANSGKILTTVGLGSAVDMAWDWITGPSYSFQQQQDLVEELQRVRTQLAEPGLEPSEAMALAQRDSEIQDELGELGIEVQANFQNEQETAIIQTNVAASGGQFITERPNLTMADTNLLMEVKRAMRRVQAQFGGPSDSLPETINALRLLMSFDNKQLSELGTLIYRLNP